MKLKQGVERKVEREERKERNFSWGRGEENVTCSILSWSCDQHVTGGLWQIGVADNEPELLWLLN